MNEAAIPVIVKILDKEYRVACQDSEQDGLLASAHYLDQKMRDIRQNGKVIGTDRIAVIAALNIAHELLQLQENREQNAEMLNRRLRSLQQRIEVALDASSQLDL